MPMDLFLTNTGDISFTTTNTLSRPDLFIYNFHVATSESLLFNFNIVNNVEPVNANSFTYNFYIYTPKYDKSVKTVSKNTYIQQAIKIRLSTELGTIRENYDLGSDIYTYMHSDLSNSKLKPQMERLVKAAISDILPNASVTIYFLNTNYLNYHDSIKIVIINDEDIYYYTL